MSWGLSVAIGIAAAIAAGRVDTQVPGNPARGAIEGRITYEGDPPPPTIVVEGGSTQHVLHVGKTGALRYVVVYVNDGRDVGPEGRGDAGPKRPAAPATGQAAANLTAVVNQRSFIFEPQVLAVRAGQAVRFTSEDSANHNVRTTAAAPANVFSIYTGAGGGYIHRFVEPPDGRPIVLSCDVHPWMAGWIYVFGHSQFAVTDEAGRFRIDDVSPGGHQLTVRQPAGGLARDLRVQIIAGRTVRQDVRFRPSDLERPAR
jgi:plastocyanin